MLHTLNINRKEGKRREKCMSTSFNVSFRALLNELAYEKYSIYNINKVSLYFCASKDVFLLPSC